MKKPIKPCTKCENDDCKRNPLTQWGCKPYRKFHREIIKYSATPEGANGGQFLSCNSCDMSFTNRAHLTVSRGARIASGVSYCYLAKKKIGPRACRKHLYPAWCPLNPCKATCSHCATRLFENEGETCPTCRRKFG